MSCDSFPDYRLAESCQEWADTLLLTRGQRFRSRTNPDRHGYFEARLLLALKCASGLAATGSGLLGGFSQLF